MQVIKEEYKYNFQVSKDGLYAIEITARCKSGEQIGIRGGEDLRVEIDDKKLREVPPKDKPQYQDIPSAWNGTKLKGLKKTVVFILRLDRGGHSIKFIPEQGSVIEGEPKIQFIENLNKIEFNLEEQAEDGDCRPWYTFVLVDLPLESLTAEATVKWRLIDSDDVKLIIDNKIQKNKFSLFHIYWLWSGSIFKKLFQKETQTKTVKIESKSGLHYIEFWADKTPTLHTVKLELGDLRTKARVVWKGGTVLRKEPKQVEHNILQELNKGDEVIVLEKAVKGERPKVNERGDLGSSNRWHKIEYRKNEGYIYSEVLVIGGESKNDVQKVIIEKAQEFNLDPEILLALADCESHFFPYTVSCNKDNIEDEVAFGVMQLSKILMIDLNDESKPYYSPIDDVFDIKQNIQAGIKYFRWLYNKYKDGKQKIEKSIAAYNSGPGDVAADQPLKLGLYDSETQRLVNCVSEHLKNKTFKKILKVSKKVLLGGVVLMALFYFSGEFISFAMNFIPEEKTDMREITLYFCQNDLKDKLCHLRPVRREFEVKEWKDYDAKYDNVVYELLNGPNIEEQKSGFISSFPQETKDLFRGMSNNRISFDRDWSQYNSHPIQSLENQLKQLKDTLEANYWHAVENIYFSFDDSEESNQEGLEEKNAIHYIRFGGLPEQYKDYHIIEQKQVDINFWNEGEDFKEKLIIINNNRKGLSMGLSKAILVRDDGFFLELPGWGEGFAWWQVGNFNDNYNLDIAVMYENSGNGAFNSFYLYEWNGQNFEIKLQNDDGGNWDNLVDLDKDSLKEIVHTWNITKWGSDWVEVFKWDRNEQEYIKANHLFPQIYKEWLEKRNLSVTGEKLSNYRLEGIPDYSEEELLEIELRGELSDCLIKKAVSNYNGIFVDIDDCAKIFWDAIFSKYES